MRLWALLVILGGVAQAHAGLNRTKRQFDADRCDPAFCQIPVSELSWHRRITRNKEEFYLSGAILTSINPKSKIILTCVALHGNPLIINNPNSKILRCLEYKCYILHTGREVSLQTMSFGLMSSYDGFSWIGAEMKRVLNGQSSHSFLQIVSI